MRKPTQSAPAKRLFVVVSGLSALSAVLMSACGSDGDAETSNAAPAPRPPSVTDGVDPRFAALLATLPRVDRGFATWTLFDEYSFIPGLKRTVTTTADGGTSTVTFALNSAGLPTKATRREGTKPGMEFLTFTYGSDPLRPTRIVSRGEFYEAVP